MKITEEPTVIKGIKGNVTIKRIDGGIPHISADNEIDLYYGLGYMHGIDRPLYMWLLKLIGEGKASEKLRADDDLIEVDKFMRWINLKRDSEKEFSKLSKKNREYLNAYCKGVNKVVSQGNRPFEFRLVGYNPDPWTPEDIFLLGKMVGYVGLAQSQGEVEKFIIQLLRNEVDPMMTK
jgi:penicillin amidase